MSARPLSGGTFAGVSELAGALLLILGGILYGFGLAKWKRPLVLTAAFLVLAGVAAALLAPRVTESVACRPGGGFLSHDAHPGQLVGAWAGWDTSYPTPYCRLELEENGRGSCAFWYGPPEGVTCWRVTAWDVRLDEIEIAIESGERREQMRGKVFDRAMSLMYFGRQGPEVRRNWFGPLWLVPEGKMETARRDVAAASETR